MTINKSDIRCIPGEEDTMSELIGRKLGKYTLEAQLGEGGMAAVYQSQHPQFHRPVAIKILPPTIGQDPSFRARFEREGRTIASLNHPSIIRVYDIDEADGLFYMVMDLLPGGTLEARLREGGLDRRWSVDVIVKMAEALDYAHAHGVIHRDIKPSNILLDAEGRPVLADFGIARMAQAEGDPNLTAAGTVMGTPAYMAPEQLSGGQPDARSDIYALGVVLYQLLAGRAPFTGDTMAVVTAHLTKQPQALRELVSDLPPALDAVVLQALAKQPEHRFKSAGVFAQALRSAAADLEPGLVRISSAARALAAPTFSGVTLPPAQYRRWAGGRCGAGADSRTAGRTLPAGGAGRVGAAAAGQHRAEILGAGDFAGDSAGWRRVPVHVLARQLAGPPSCARNDPRDHDRDCPRGGAATGARDAGAG